MLLVRKLVMDLPLWRRTRSFTEESNAHNCRNVLAERKVSSQEQGRNVLNIQEAGFERAANAWSGNAGHNGLSKTKQSKPGRLIKLRYLKEINIVAGDALANQRKNYSIKQRRNFKGIKGIATSICKNVSRDMDCLSLFLEDHIFRICKRHADLVCPNSCNMCVNI